VAIAALEDAGLLTWVHRLVKVRHRERDLFGHWGSEWQVHRPCQWCAPVSFRADGR
jgi:hypothetical protein